MSLHVPYKLPKPFQNTVTKHKFGIQFYIMLTNGV